MAVTTKDLAKLCGVSRTTVSRALHGTGRIHPDTKARILRLAEELDYKPDLVARSLVKGRTGCIGIIVFDLRNQFFSEMINAIENKAKQLGYLLNITLHEGDLEIEQQLINTLVGHRMDGLIISPANRTPQFEAQLRGLAIPVVAVGHRLFQEIPCVGIDESLATTQAATYLLQKGYRRIAFVLPPEQPVAKSGGHEQRLEGFLEAVQQFAGVSYEVICQERYWERALAIVREGGEKAAFLCSGDVFAFQILVELEKQGYLPKEHYGLMGFDGQLQYRSRSPVLTSVWNPVTEIGNQSIELLISLIEQQGSKTNKVIPSKIMQGDTV